MVRVSPYTLLKFLNTMTRMFPIKTPLDQVNSGIHWLHLRRVVFADSQKSRYVHDLGLWLILDRSITLGKGGTWYCPLGRPDQSQPLVKIWWLSSLLRTDRTDLCHEQASSSSSIKLLIRCKSQSLTIRIGVDRHTVFALSIRFITLCSFTPPSASK